MLVEEKPLPNGGGFLILKIIVKTFGGKDKFTIFVIESLIKNIEIMSKAAEKRASQARERISYLIKNNLLDFQNQYLGDYASFKIREIENRKADWVKLLNPEALEAYNKKNREYAAVYRRRYYYDSTIKDIEWQVKKCDLELANPNIKMLDYLSEAKKGYDTKVEKVIDTVAGYNMSTAFMQIERVGTAGHEFSFLISNKEMEVHARVIYACGEINAPHYRFIVTMRRKKLADLMASVKK